MNVTSDRRKAAAPASDSSFSANFPEKDSSPDAIPTGAVGRFNEFLSSIALLPPDADFLTAAATAMAHLIGARLLTLSTFDPETDTLTFHALAMARNAEAVLQTHDAPWSPGATLRIPSSRVRQALLSGTLQSIEHNDGLLFGNAPADICARVKQTLGISACYAVGMVWRNTIVGCIMFGMAGASAIEADLIEACAHQVASLHQQRRIEQMLHETNAQLEARVRERTAQLEAANRALQASEEKYRRLFHNAQAGMFRSRMDGSAVLDVNAKLAQILNKPVQEIIGKPSLFNWAEPEKRSELLQMLQTREQVGEFEMPTLTGDGEIRTLLLSITAYPQENLLEGTAIDITERKAMEEALREGERRITNLLHNLPGMVYRCRNEPRWTSEFLSEGSTELTGYAPEDLINNRRLAFVDLIEPEDREMVWDTVQAGVRENGSFEITYRIRTATGVQKWVWEKGSAVRGPDGSVLALEGFITDISAIKAAQEAVRASEMRFRALFEATNIGTAIVGVDGRLLEANPALSHFLEYTQAELCGMSIADLTYPDDYTADATQLQQLVDGVISAYTMEKRYITKSGRVTWGLLTASIARELDGAPLFLIGQVQGIDERKRVQAELEQLYRRTQQDAQEKAILLNEVNHRVKNNLMAILGLLLAEGEFVPPEQRPLLETTYQNIARRIKSLLEVHQMLSASEWSSLSLSELIERVIHTERSGHAQGDYITVQVTPSSIKVSPRNASNLAIIITELFSNSCKHVASVLSGLCVKVTLAMAEDQIVIEYRDNGLGYSADVLEGQRNGVGLYLIRRIVEGTLRGKVTLNNDHGAIACIYIPVKHGEHADKVMTV